MIPEIIRYQTPLVCMRRRATQEYEIRGKTIQKSDKIPVWYVYGNRDNEIIDNPNEFIVDRDTPRHHLSFGFGIHRCMGNRLAEMKLQIVREEILKRFKRIEVVREPGENRSSFVKGHTDLKVVVTAR